MNRRTHDDVADLSSALSWLRKAWHTLPVAPTRLHDRDIEDQSRLGALKFSAAMERLLDAGPYATMTIVEEMPCEHREQDAAKRQQGELCQRCCLYAEDGTPISETGVIKARRVRYRWPMAAALTSLSKMPRPSDGTPAPIDCILALRMTPDLDHAARLVGVPIVSADHRRTVEAMMLMNLRRLRDRYSEAPLPRVGWVDKSEAQRSAEEAA